MTENPVSVFSRRWYYNRNQREEPIEESSGHYVMRDGSLIIQSVEENDAGSYMCTASNSEGSETLEIRLTVSAPLSVHVQPAIQTVDLGKSAYLTCTASGFPQAALYWLKDGQPLRTGARVRTVSSERISVTSVAREDRGMYQCFVRNEYEMAQGIAELRLGEIAPQLVYRFIEQTMQPGPSVSLKCSAAGNPTPQISWLLDGFPLPQNDRLLIGQYVTVYGDVISHVNITTVKPEDGGEYECIASSRAGEARHSARLNIYGLPYVRPMSPVSAVAGKQLYIKCPVAGYPIESIVWEKGDIKLPTNMRQRVANGTLFIDTVQRSADEGTYTCTARNKHNFTSHRSVEVRVLGLISTGQHRPESSVYRIAHRPSEYMGAFRTRILSILSIAYALARHSNASCAKIRIENFTLPKEYISTNFFHVGRLQSVTHLIFFVPPKITPFSFARDLNVGDRTSVQCVVVTGDLPLTFTWLKDNVPIETRKSITIGIHDAFTSALSISTIAPAHNGTYTCRVTNGAATVAHSALLHVNVPPRISPFFFGDGVMEGQRTQLMCTTSQGDQPFNITWLMDEKPIQVRSSDGGTSVSNGIQISDYPPFSSILTINSVSASHSGNYTCQISNVAGLAEHSTSLSVAEYTPDFRNICQMERTFYVLRPFEFTLCSSCSEVPRAVYCTFQFHGTVIPLPLRLTISTYVCISSHIRVCMYIRFSAILHALVFFVLFRFERKVDNSEIVIARANESNNTWHDAAISRFLSIIFEDSSIEFSFAVGNRGSHGQGMLRQSNRVDDRCIADFTCLHALPPRWTVEPIDQNAVVGHGVSIACQAEGFPIPTVTWKQSIGETPGDYRELGYGTEGAGMARNGSLVIPRVSRDHAGFYLCQASNGIGPGLSKLIRLTVHAGPQVTVRTRQESVRRGESVILRCEAEGDAPLDLSWRVRDSKIDPNYDVRYAVDNTADASGRVTTELRIIQASHMDRGDYVCVAANAYGRDKTTIHLLVQEPPDFPRNLHVAEQGSRSILLAWSSPATDRDASHISSPITNYIVQYKEAQDVWHEHNTQKLVAGDNTVARVSPLKPATTYHFRVLAENHLGTSAPSDILHVQTDGEVPGGPPRHVSVEPLGPQQLKITWQPPDRSLWNGELLGYTIGYTNLGGDDQLTNTTRVGITGNGDGSHDYRLTGLRKYTQYSIVVKAFNSKGDGPGSDPVTAHTFEDVPSAPPQNVACAALNGQNIQVTWKPPPSDKVHGVVLGYKLLYEAASDSQTSRETKVSHALSTVLHSLSPYTNYTVQVLAYTRAGDGVTSTPVSCTTGETVPDAPERVKAVISGENAVVISWLPPRRPNGLLVQYTVYVRVLEQGQEVKITKNILPAQNLHHEATGLKQHETYEAWVTASTKVGQGSSTPVIKLQPSTTVPAAIVSYGVSIVVPWRVDVNMACLVVGDPRPSVEWRRADMKLQQKSDVGPDNTLTLRNVQRSHEDNYSCHVKNSLGTDEITYTLHIQVPPTSPTLLATGTTTDAIQLQWKQGDNGGAPIKGFLLAYRREFAEWEEVMLDRRESTHLLEGLQCGTRYQFTLAAFNRIGSGSASDIQTAKTNGSKPVPPPKHHFVRPNQTFVILELAAWQDGGCPLTYFVVEYRRLPGDWLLVSNNVPPQSKFPIVDLESGTSYELRVTAYNNAGSTQAEYLFSTLSPNGNNRLHEDHPQESENTPLYLDAHVLAPSVISVLAVMLAIAGVCFCLKTREYKPVEVRSINLRRKRVRPERERTQTPTVRDAVFHVAKKKICRMPFIFAYSTWYTL
ncbi:hypothetical protein ALC62_08745 [Cyphomyrmex costatus]|uniref:Down syndrome cell adhesion molecule-like protein Dscam2 n=1 Tax=Cyphomyrmex costatus TaxID=456900 RepID=A0A195CI85_9HYME|nr:hypothetical protein ALC62_08745 [Cyphomyrmex costatus]